MHLEMDRIAYRILLAEDDPNDLELILQGLHSVRLAGEVMVVRDGADALDYLLARGRHVGRAEGLPALVLLDLKMPRMSGLDVLREMRADSLLMNLPVVMLTSSREESDIAQAYAFGCNAFVVKPVGYQDFIESVKSIGHFWAHLNEPPRECRRSL